VALAGRIAIQMPASVRAQGAASPEAGWFGYPDFRAANSPAGRGEYSRPNLCFHWFRSM